MNIIDTVSPKLKKIIHELHANGGDIFFVGGCVRDKFLNKSNKDVDLEIHNITVDKTLNILKQFGEVNEVGKSFGVLKVNGINVDFAFPRTENKTGNKHTDFDVQVKPFLSLKESAQRRDFTMNAIMENAVTGEIVDPFNGINDIKNKTIKFVNANTFVEDPLRALRAAQFSARFNMTIDESVINLSKNFDLTNLPKSRIAEEFNKGLMKSSKPSIMFMNLHKMGLLKQLTIIDDLNNVPQNPEFHPEGNVFKHTMQAIDLAAQIKNDATDPRKFMFAVLVHDIGKLTTTKVVNKKIVSYKHAEESARLAPLALKNLVTDKDTIKFASALAQNHMKMHQLLNMKPTKLRKMMVTENMNDLLLLNVADNSKGGRTVSEAKTAAQFDEKLTRLHQLEQGANLKVVPFVQGRDLIKIGFVPGPDFKSLLDEALTLQIANDTKEHILNVLERRKAEN